MFNGIMMYILWCFRICMDANYPLNRPQLQWCAPFAESEADIFMKQLLNQITENPK